LTLWNIGPAVVANAVNGCELEANEPDGGTDTGAGVDVNRAPDDGTAPVSWATDGRVEPKANDVSTSKLTPSTR
jgi:hypothetical protein